MHTIWGTTTKPEASKMLADFFAGVDDQDATLYIGYPIVSGLDFSNTIDALLVSKAKGVVAIHIVEGRDVNDVEEIQEELYGKLYSRLFSNRKLLKKRQPLFHLDTATFAPIATQPGDFDDDVTVLFNTEQLSAWFDDLPDANPDVYESVVSTIQSLTNIRGRKRKRELKREDSRGSSLNLIEDSIANLDARQSSAVIETIHGVQRIRGLAGSGKTIILALKVAYLHASSPEWNIAVTFNTRSLKGLFERLINTFYIDQTGEEPDWEKIHVLHAWGSAGDFNRGIYYETCIQSGVEYLDFGTAKRMYTYDTAFDSACERALKEIKQKEIDLSGKYDVILVDEAQDFNGAFLQLCYELLTEKKRLVYAYDELQSLDEKTLPSPEELFGISLNNEEGKPKKDIILEKCYRNPRQILVAAHAVGFGIYTEGGDLVQIFDESSLWEEIGYKVENGIIEDGKNVVLKRDGDSSPEFLENHSPEDDIVQFIKFDSAQEQDDWIVEEITKNINEDDLRPEDIVVINPNAITTRDAVGYIRSELLKREIDSSLVGVSTSKDKFLNEGKVAFTGIHRAKGNEAGMVYIINSQYCYQGYGLAKKRNTLFTAMTRAKAWVRVCGHGESMEGLKDEFSRLKANDFTLNFTYPTAEQRAEMRTINRDLSREEKKQIAKSKARLQETVHAIESGKVALEDLPQDLIDRLKNIIK